MSMPDFRPYRYVELYVLDIKKDVTQSPAFFYYDNENDSISDIIDNLNDGIKFMLSYVIEHKGKVNETALEWIEKNHYRIIELGDVIGISGSRRKEVLIVNYDNQ